MERLCRHPVRWDKTTIIVMNEVRVSSPYLAESVTGGTPAANNRVRKVVRVNVSLILHHMLSVSQLHSHFSPFPFLLYVARTGKEKVTNSWGLSMNIYNMPLSRHLDPNDQVVTH